MGSSYEAMIEPVSAVSKDISAKISQGGIAQTGRFLLLHNSTMKTVIKIQYLIILPCQIDAHWGPVPITA